MKRPIAELIPLLTKGAAPATAIATGLVAPLAQAATGDLDPAYADHGRLGPIAGLEGPAWSVATDDQGGSLLGGGYTQIHCGWFYCWYDFSFESTNFIESITEEGDFDGVYQNAEVTSVEVFDIARQADGKAVAAGRRVFGRRAVSSKLVVFRLEANGALDEDFGNGGLVEFEDATLGTHNQARAILVDPDGRLVIAGSRDDALMVIRLNADGSIDQSFGNGGIFAGAAQDPNAANSLARVSSGGYRVTTADGTSCRVVGLTSNGAVDAAYGDAGYALVAPELGGAVSCHSAAAQTDDRLLVAGMAASQTFAVRLLASGAPDPSFAAVEVPLTMHEATAVAVAPDGKILIGGDGLNGATVMRLQATGELDELFGGAGRTTIDLPSETGASPWIHDIAVQADGAALVAGGDYAGGPPRPFAVRLLGDGGGDSAGVIGIVPGEFVAAEGGEVAVTVRRTGGTSGAVSVAYRGETTGFAEEGLDYQVAAGTLQWADGEADVRTIVVPILADAGAPEEPESFRLVLDDAGGGAGLATREAEIQIQADGAPAGQFGLDVWETNFFESGILQFQLMRNYYAEGEVCVTLQATSGSATAGEDFTASPVTHCWADQDGEPKFVEIPIVDDRQQEAVESFTLELSDPTGGAVIGPRGAATITIAANDAPVQEPPRRGGGGSTGFCALLLLGLAELLRSARRRRGNRS
jgi:uncharacterized delta-60 repeat protein